MDKSPILISGAHRSGTTWLGKMISKNNQVGYIYEPFNMNYFNNIKVPYWFYYLKHDDENEIIKKELDKVINFNYNIKNNLKNINNIKNVLRVVKTFFDFQKNKYSNSIPLIKDPIAIMSAEYIYKEYSAKIIISIRHPAAIISSYVKHNYNHPFYHFLKQEELMSDKLSSFTKKIHHFSEEKQEVIDQGILLYNIIYSVIKEYQKKHKDWLFVKYEDITGNPIESFKKIFAYLDLDYNQTDLYEIEKETYYNPKPYQDRLTEKEINYIKENTKGIWDDFYSTEEW